MALLYNHVLTIGDIENTVVRRDAVRQVELSGFCPSSTPHADSPTLSIVPEDTRVAVTVCDEDASARESNVRGSPGSASRLWYLAYLKTQELFALRRELEHNGAAGIDSPDVSVRVPRTLCGLL